MVSDFVRHIDDDMRACEDHAAITSRGLNKYHSGQMLVSDGGDIVIASKHEI